MATVSNQSARTSEPKTTQNNYATTRQFLTYYGGKTRIRDKIIELFPNDFKIYCEPFVGGGAVLAGFGGAEINIINDINGNITNFYSVLQNKLDEFIEAEQSILHDEFHHKRHQKIWKTGEGSDIERAVAIFRLQFNFGGNLERGFAGIKRCLKSIENSRKVFKKQSKLLSDVIILNRDALEVFDYMEVDTPDTLFYIDPPYPNTDCGHYAGYTTNDFLNLLKRLEDVKGKFILSCYHVDNEEVQSYLSKYHKHEIKIFCSAAKSNKGERTELLYMNYKPAGSLF